MIKKISFIIVSVLITILLVLITPTQAFGDAKSDLDAANNTASEASNAYDEAVNKQNELAQSVQNKTTELTNLETIELPKAQNKFNNAVKEMYRNNISWTKVVLDAVLGYSLEELLSLFNAVENIVEWRKDAINDLKTTKEEINIAKTSLEAEKVKQDEAVEAAAAKKKEALDAQSAARASYNKTLPKNIPSTRRARTSTTFYDEDSAKAFIVMKESGGNYNARNGRYIGAYQLTNTYLDGDYSPENQDRVAQRYVDNRYGGWMGAANFWVSHGWY